MDFDEAKSIIIDLLTQKGKAKNSEMIKAIGGDANLLETVREDLIFNDIAEDKKGVGLIYLGSQPGEASDREIDTGNETSTSITHKTLDSDDAQSVISYKRIFISYGRADTQELAFKLEQDLTSKGYRVWLDKNQMRAGRSWEEQIEQAILENEVFISLLSPHAIRRPDGVCLDEISMARYNNRQIIPAMVIQCRPPLGIYRLDWVDLQEWQNPMRYEIALQKLLTAIDEQQAVEGIYARIFSVLKPLDFSIEIAKHTKDFIGREWLDEELQCWLEDDKSRVFFITGDPGTGKTAMLAQIVHKHPLVIAYHFCISSLEDSRNPLIFVRSLAAQLATQLQDYRAALEALELDNIAEGDAGTLLRRIIAEPLKAEKSDRPALIVVDALDESYSYGMKNIARVLRDRLEDLPQWIRLVISSRKEPEILDMFSNYQPHEIMATCLKNGQDIRAHLRRKFQEPKFQEILIRTGTDLEFAIELLCTKCEGNFLYANYALMAIETGRLDLQKPDAFPEGLVGIYQFFFERLFPEGKLHEYKLILPIIEILLAAREPLTGQMIASFSDFDITQTREYLQKIAEFFPEREGAYQVYHKSLSDWLRGEVGRSRLYNVDIVKGHKLIGDALFLKYKEGKSDRFLIAHLPAHLIGAQCWDELLEILTNLRFIEAKCQIGLTHDLIEDYQMSLVSIPEAIMEVEKEQNRERRIRSWIENIIRYSQQWNHRLKKYYEDPQHNLLPVTDEIMLPELIPSVQFYHDDEAKGEFERIAGNQKPLEQLRDFSHFISSQSHFLARLRSRPGFCIQQAYNYARNGPVAQTAEKLVKEGISTPQILKDDLDRNPYNPHPTNTRILEGHEDNVCNVSITPDGRLGISGGHDKTVRLWDLESGKCMRVMRGHRDLEIESVTSIAITSDGKNAISAGRNGTLKYWDLENGECIRTMTGHTKSINKVLMASNDKYAISGGDDGAIRIWDLENGNCIKMIEISSHGVTALCTMSDDRRFISGSTDGVIRFWDLSSCECMGLIEGHNDRVNGICITPDDRLMVSGGGHTLCLWDIKSAKCLRVMEGHTETEYISCLSKIFDGKKVISGSSDSNLRLWDLETGTCLQIFEASFNVAKSVIITPDGKKAISVGSDHPLLFCDLETGTSKYIIDEDLRKVSAISLSPDGRWAVSAGYGIIALWDMEDLTCIKKIKRCQGSVRIVRITPDGAKALSGSSDFTARLWETRTGACLRVLKGHTDAVCSVDITPDGHKAITGSEDKTLRLWDLESGKCLKILGGHAGQVWAVAMTPDGRLAVSGDSKNAGILKFWDLVNGKCLNSLQGHAGAIPAVSISPDGKYAVTGSYDCTLRLWDLEQGKCVHVMEGHSGEIYGVSITHDGKRAISVSGDNTFRLWNLETGESVVRSGRFSCVSMTPDGNKAISGQKAWGFVNAKENCISILSFPKSLEKEMIGGGPICSLAISPHGKRLVSGSGDKTFCLWETMTKRKIYESEKHKSWCYILITPDCQRIISCSDDRDDRNLRQWDLESGTLISESKRGAEPERFMALTPDGKMVVSNIRSCQLEVHDLEERLWRNDSLRTIDESWGVIENIIPDGKAVIIKSNETDQCWNIETGNLLFEVEASGDHRSIGLTSPDGRNFIYVRDYNVMEIFNFRTGERIDFRLNEHAGQVNSLFAFPDGQRIISQSSDNVICIWDLRTQECLAAYCSNEKIMKIAYSHPQLIVGTGSGRLEFLRIYGLPFTQPPIVTPIRLWLFGPARNRWDKEITYCCAWCGERSISSHRVIDVIKGITAHLSPHQSPCLELPDEAWDEPRLLSECSQCKRPLKFNPFLVDNRNRS